MEKIIWKELVVWGLSKNLEQNVRNTIPCQGNESINNFKELGFYHKDFCVTEI